MNMEVFNQLIDLDDEEEDTYEFSQGMVSAYFTQAVETFGNIDEAL
jgi:hypothetical protein